MIATETNRQRAELWTWRFGAALANVTRIAWVIECHFADAYDEIRFYLDDPQKVDDPVCVTFNRNGRLHLLGVPNHDRVEPLEVLHDGGSILPVTEAVSWVLENVALLAGTPDPQLGRSLHLISELLTEAVDNSGSGPWEWRSGYLDTGSGCSRREAYFGAVPATADACLPAQDDLLGIPDYRFWFLVGPEEIPNLAVELATGNIFVGR